MDSISLFEKGYVMERRYKKYTFEGAAERCCGDSRFCMNPRWSAQTYAPTRAKAMSNLKFKFKQENGLVPGVKIELTGELKEDIQKE